MEAVRIVMKAVVSTILGLVVIAVLLFLPAGTVAYWQGWAFLATLIFSAGVPNFYLWLTNRAAFERRLQAGRETRPAQHVAIAVLMASFAGLLVVSALDVRLGWSSVPTVVSLMGDGLFAVGIVLAVVVVVQNSYAAGNVTVEGGQRLVFTGLYGIVRHPMYSFALLAMFGCPFALGSWWAMGFLVPIVIALVLRIRDEEQLLTQELDGYPAYMRTTRFRLVPYAW